MSATLGALFLSQFVTWKEKEVVGFWLSRVGIHRAVGEKNKQLYLVCAGFFYGVSPQLSVFQPFLSREGVHNCLCLVKEFRIYNVFSVLDPIS